MRQKCHKSNQLFLLKLSCFCEETHWLVISMSGCVISSSTTQPAYVTNKLEIACISFNDCLVYCRIFSQHFYESVFCKIALIIIFFKEKLIMYLCSDWFCNEYFNCNFDGLGLGFLINLLHSIAIYLLYECFMPYFRSFI